jgi:hypothetical protein
VFTPVLQQNEVAVELMWHGSYITEMRIPSTVVSQWLKIDAHYDLRFSAVNIKFTVFWDVTLYGLVDVFAGTCHLHLDIDARKWRQRVPPKHW